VVLAQNANNVDSLGRKQGLWIERKGQAEAYYKDDLRNGVFKAYNRKNGKLSGFGEYKEGVKSGIWYYFDNSSYLILIESNIRKNERLTRIRDDAKAIKPINISYAKFYYPSGTIKKEGLVLYDEDIEIDYYKTGQWKYYTENGKLLEVKAH
jgi:antitoxin component YwqK of YwqJK toxin-antitoxin module